MPHQVVGLAQQFLALEAADLDECMVAVGDAPLEVGHGHECFVGGESELPLCDGQIVAHGWLLGLYGG